MNVSCKQTELAHVLQQARDLVVDEVDQAVICRAEAVRGFWVPRTARGIGVKPRHRTVVLVRPVADDRFRRGQRQVAVVIDLRRRERRMGRKVRHPEEEGRERIAAIQEAHGFIGAPRRVFKLFRQMGRTRDPGVTVQAVGNARRYGLYAHSPAANSYSRSLPEENSPTPRDRSRSACGADACAACQRVGSDTPPCPTLPAGCARLSHGTPSQYVTMPWVTGFWPERIVRRAAMQEGPFHVSAWEVRAGGGEVIEIGRADHWMPVDAQAVAAMLVGSDQQNVGLLHGRAFPIHTRRPWCAQRCG